MWCILLLFSILIFPWISKGSDIHRIYGVYTQRTRFYWVKVLVFYIFINVRRFWQKISVIRGKSSKNLHTGAGYGVKSRSSIDEMECVQELSEHPKAIDAVYFNAADRCGNYFVMAAARRPHGVINGLLFIRIPEVGILELPKIPDTLLFGDGSGFSAEGLKIEPIKPMKSWRLEYKGQMKFHQDDSRSVHVEMDAIWSSSLPWFDFDTDMNSLALAKAMSLEPWTRQYFQGLKDAHQTHYEQMGRLNGRVKIDGEIHELNLDSLRDHSYGHKREWKLIHRYALHMIHTEDGHHINASIICQPMTSSNLELGYLNLPNGEIVSVSSVELPLWQHGEQGTTPKDYSFSFTAGGKKYLVEVELVASPYFHIGWEWETKVTESFAKFRVNGVPGWGIAEWDHRFKDGRPSKYENNDPDWTKSLNKG